MPDPVLAALMIVCVGICSSQQAYAQKDQERKQFASSDGVLSISLNRFADKSIVPREKVVRPNITTVVYLEGDHKLQGAIVHTKIRPDYPQGDELLDTQKPRFEAMQRALGDAFKLEDSRNDSGRYLAYTFNGETYEKAAFPFGVTRDQSGDSPKTIGGHHFFVRNGYFFEIAVVLATDAADLDSRRDEVQRALTRIFTAMDTEPKDR